jgi:hypothetical protein
MNDNRRILAVALVGTTMASQAQPLTTGEISGRIEAKLEDKAVFAWQAKPLKHPVGGEKFKGSAFLHPLRTPSGFEWTTCQPKDHLHHFGLWWPWKSIEVDGVKYNTWEIQEAQGGMVARGVKVLSNGPDQIEWEFTNETMIQKSGAAALAAIHETTKVGLTMNKDSQILDICIHQKAAAAPVKIVNYRYSGFSWRGPLSWNKDNSKMSTSDGKGRDDANGTPARWVMVSGPTPGGSATVLLMSAASKLAGTPEKLRVWDSKNLNGMPFANFNPVMEKSLPLDEAHPAVSMRKYRVIATDHGIDATEAEAEWKKWMAE